MQSLKLILFFGALSINSLYGQLLSNNNLSEKIYIGNHPFLEKSGYYYFCKDSSFWFVFNNTLNKKLTGIGNGKWYIQKDSLILNYKELSPNQLNNNQIIYTSFSNPSIDSNYFNLSVKSETGHLSGASVFFPDLAKGGTTTHDGSYKCTMSRLTKVNKIKISLVSYQDQEIFLMPDKNQHNITFILAPEKTDKITILPASEQKFWFKKKKGNDLVFSLGLVLKDDGISKSKFKQVVSKLLIENSELRFFIKPLLKRLEN